MSEDLVFDVPENVKADALVDEAKYHEMYAESLRDPEAFWGEHGKRIDWMRPYTKVKNTLYSKEDVSIKWYEDGTLNACVNCRPPSEARATILRLSGKVTSRIRSENHLSPAL